MTLSLFAELFEHYPFTLWESGLRNENTSETGAIGELISTRARIIAELNSESDIARKLLTLAGGKGYGTGKRKVTMQSGGMAARAARYVYRLRGIQPSSTSLDDAAASAAAKLWFEWQCYSALCGDDFTHCAIRHLAGYAWRAAFNSFTRDASEGRTGRKAGQGEQDHGAAIPLDQAQLQIESQSLQAWARDMQGRIFTDVDRDNATRARRNRRKVLSWLRDTLITLPKSRKLTNGQREQRKAQVARFSLLARLVHGREWAIAARGAGFANGHIAAMSFHKAKVWPMLRNAATSQPTSQTERNLIAIRKRSARQASQAIKRQRNAWLANIQPSLPSLPGYAHGAIPVALPGGVWLARASAKVPVAVTIPAGTATVHYSPAIASNAIAASVGKSTVTRPVASRKIICGVTSPVAVHPLAEEWQRATEQRAQATMIAKSARAQLRAIRAKRIAAWDSATKGLRKGNAA